jgi:hypothetical protein
VTGVADKKTEVEGRMWASVQIGIEGLADWQSRRLSKMDSQSHLHHSGSEPAQSHSRKDEQFVLSPKKGGASNAPTPPQLSTDRPQVLTQPPTTAWHCRQHLIVGN